MSLAEKSVPGPVRYRNQATGRVLSVLLAFTNSSQPRGVAELSRALGMNKNMVHRALTTLTAEGYLVRDVSGARYQLGPRLLTLPAGALHESDIVALARPALEQLHALTGESVYLSIIVGRNRVTVDDIQAQGARVLRSARGHPVPLHCTKMSRVLLAHLSDADIAAYLAAAAPLARASRFPDPPSESERGIWQDIAAIRAVPFLLWRNPHASSAAYAIFPVCDASGHPHAILTVGGPRERFDLAEIEARLPRMRAILEPLEREARLFPAPIFLAEI
ncbi:MAG TPA: IclR family transcriptional regulator [Micropepsaceae bacterium]